MEKTTAKETLASKWRQAGPWRKAFYMTIPALIVLIGFYYYPILKFVPFSIVNDDGDLTFEYFARVFTDSLYRDSMIRTVKIALMATVINILLGYPLAYTMTKVSQKAANIMMSIIMISFWTSLLVRTYSWMVLLQKNGIINNILFSLGIISQKKTWLYTEIAVLVGMTNILLPYSILPIYSVMKALDPNLPIAAMSMGATKTQAFLKVTLPLSLSGVASAVMLLFIQALGFYITPMLLGGAQTLVITGLIDKQIYTFLNWHFGSALGMVLLLITIIFLIGFDRLFGIDKLTEAMS